MKRLIITLGLIVALFCSPKLYGFNTEEIQDGEQMELLKPIKKSNGHEAPGRIFIKCHYRKGHILFELPSHINGIRVSVGDEEVPVWQTWVTDVAPECDIPKLIGEYEITCRTDGNQIFKGKLRFTN